MGHALALALLSLASLGLAILIVQAVALRRHLSAPAPAPRTRPGISILKPLCGVEDGLQENLLSFAALEWPRYEVLLGLRDASDGAHALAREMAARFPDRFRVVLQRGEPGQNPKVNQLITLARSARHEILVVSDSNVRVEPGYLSEIAAHLEDPAVGLVTHAIAGAGEEGIGPLFDHLQLAGWVAPGVVAAKRIAGRDIVVGKSMAFRRADLATLGGFEAVKDVLAEDYVLGTLVTRRLGKGVAVAHRPVVHVGVSGGLREFAARYARWAVLHRTMTGRALHVGQAILNPVLLGVAAAAVETRPATLLALGAICAGKAGIDGACGRALRPGGFTVRQLALVPAKDLLFGWFWARALWHSDVVWRGNRIQVLRGTRIGPQPAPSLPVGLATIRGAR
jgi:ceramide glucosyltransferase